MSAASSAPSTRSITQPRVPRMRPPRTWKTCTAASKSSLTSENTSASEPSSSTTALRSSTVRSALTSSRSFAARSKLSSMEA